MLRRLFLLALVAAAVPGGAHERGPLVLAAASLQDALGEAADVWVKGGHSRPVLSFAASSALARQVMSGARADLFVSADEEWMNAVAKAGRVAPGTRAALAGNRLVVIAGPGVRGRLTVATLGRVLAAGPVAMADPSSVPAGRYGQAALARLGAWEQVRLRVVRAENVRAALLLVERGVAPYGIVYATDARASSRVRVVGVFPAGSHPPIRYPIARLKGGVGEGFRRFLLGSEGRRILLRHGFIAP